MKTEIEFRNERLKKYIEVLPQALGGPGSGRTAEGGGGNDDADVEKIKNTPPEKRSEQQIKKLYKKKPKQDLKDIVIGNKDWIKKNSDKVGSVEHRTKSRELNVADKILKGFY